MNSNARALKMLDMIQMKTGLTDSGKKALIQLINPFTDFALERAGYFDTMEAASCVQAVKYSQTIAVPSAVVGNWDCHVFNTPMINFNNPGFMTDCVTTSGCVAEVTALANAMTVGGVTCIRGPAGADLSVVTSAIAANSVICSANLLSPSGAAGGLLDGLCRVIGMGFEVHNTTAKINAQGSVCVYRSPQSNFLDRFALNYLQCTGTVLAPLTPQFTGAVTARLINDVPRTLADALLLDGSRQWEAMDGAMCVPTLCDSSIPVQRLWECLPIVCSVDQPVTLGGLVTSGSTCRVPTRLGNIQGVTFGTATTGNIATQQDCHMSNFNSSGAYFTGLSNASTLTINSIYYIERFPTMKITEQNLVLLATASPPYDPVAIELYSHIMRQLPVGVKVGDNADGDWFFDAISAIGRFIPKIAGALGPLGIPAAALGTAADQWAQNKLKERNKKPTAPGSSWPQPRTRAIAAPPKKSVPKPGQGRPQNLKISREEWNKLTAKQRAALTANLG